MCQMYLNKLTATNLFNLIYPNHKNYLPIDYYFFVLD